MNISTELEPHILKIVVLGDSEVGKSSLIISYTDNNNNNTTSPGLSKQANKPKNSFANYSTTITLDDKEFEICIWDTNASTEYEHIRPLNFAKTDLFLICFSVANPSSLANISEKWNQEIKNHFGPGKEDEPPKLLVGLQADWREEDDGALDFSEDSPRTTKREVLASSSNNKKSKEKIATTTKEQGMQMAREIGAVDYLECSALTGDGVGSVFEAVVNAAAYPMLHSGDLSQAPVTEKNTFSANDDEREKEINKSDGVVGRGAGRRRGRKKRCVVC